MALKELTLKAAQGEWADHLPWVPTMGAFGIIRIKGGTPFSGEFPL